LGLINGSKKTSITALRLHLESVIYKSKLLASKYFASLVLDTFLKPFEKHGVFLEAITPTKHQNEMENLVL